MHRLNNQKTHKGAGCRVQEVSLGVFSSLIFIQKDHIQTCPLANFETGVDHDFFLDSRISMVGHGGIDPARPLEECGIDGSVKVLQGLGQRALLSFHQP